MINKNKRYFTLLELIIVIVVIGILAGMALPKFTGVIRNSKVAAMVTDIDTLEKAIMMYQQDNDTLPLLEETKTFGLQRLSKNDMSEIYTSLQEVLKFSEDSEEYLYKINLDESGKYHSKTKYGHGKTDKDFYVYSTKSNKVYYYDYLTNGDGYIQHNDLNKNLKETSLVDKKPSVPSNTKPPTNDNSNTPDDIKPIWSVLNDDLERYKDVIATKDNGYIAVGRFSSDCIIEKYDKNGELLWTKTFNHGDIDSFNKVVEDKDGNYYVGGYKYISGYDYGILFKIDKDGNKVWEKDMYKNKIEEVVLLDNGNILAISSNNMYLYDLEGKEIKNTKLTYTFNSISKNNENNLVMISSRYYNSNTYLYVSIFDQNLNKILYEQSIGYTNDMNLKLIQDEKNDYIITGMVRNNNWGEKKGVDSALIGKLNSNFEGVWSKTIGGKKYNYYKSIVKGDKDTFISVGTVSNGGDFEEIPNDNNNKRGIITIFDSNGKSVTNKLIGSANGNTEINSIKRTNDNGYIICGSTTKGGEGLPNGNGSFIIKLDKNLNLN